VAAALVKGQCHRHVGPLEQLLTIREKAIDQPREPRRGGVEGGAEASPATCSSSLATTEGSIWRQDVRVATHYEGSQDEKISPGGSDKTLAQGHGSS